MGFGLFYLLLERSPLDSALWPMLGTRISLVALLALAVAVTGLSLPISAGTSAGLLGLGVVNTLADLLFLLATQMIGLGIAAASITLTALG